MNTKVSFDSLPEAVGYLTEQVMEIKEMLGALQMQPSSSTNRLIGIEEASALIQKAKPTIYAIVHKGPIPACKRGKLECNSCSEPTRAIPMDGRTICLVQKLQSLQ